MKKILMMLTLALIVGACSKDDAAVPNIESITINENQIALQVGGSKTLTTTITPADLSDVAVKWVSGDKAVATVANGVVTGVAAGETTIKASVGNKSATAKVKVLGADESSIILSIDGKGADAETPYVIARGETLEVLAEVLPEDNEAVIVWSSDDEAVATVDRGMITAVESGEATIKAKYKNAEATIKVKVVVMPTGIHLTTDFEFPNNIKTEASMINSPKNGVDVYVHIDPLDGAENTGVFELEIEDESVLEVKDGIDDSGALIQFFMAPKDFTPGDKHTKVTVYYYPVPEDKSIVFSASINVTMTDKGYQVDDKGDWEIYSSDGLYAYLVYCNMNATPAEIKAKASQHVKITKDITATFSWEPLFNVEDKVSGSVDYEEYGFSGVFDGGGHTIMGLDQPLFAVLSGGTIKNLKLTNPGKTISGRAGFVVDAFGGSTIENCHLKGSTTTLSGDFVGGIAHKITGGSVIKDCTNEAAIRSTNSAAGIVTTMSINADNLVIGCVNKGEILTDKSAGGIVCNMTGEGVVKDCENKAKVHTATAQTLQYVGGIVATIEVSNRSLNAKIIDCKNSGDVYALRQMFENKPGTSYAGGILGMGAVFEIENCHMAEDYEVYGVNAGGIVGTVLSDTSITRAKITNCSSMGSVCGNKYAGGIVGMAHRVIISASYNPAEGFYSDYNSSSEAYIGGIAGCSNGAIIYGCYSDAPARISSSKSYSAGFIGLIEDQWQTEITSCYALRFATPGAREDRFAHLASGASYVVRNSYTNGTTAVSGVTKISYNSYNSSTTIAGLNSGLNTHYSSFGWKYVTGTRTPALQAK